ncbi:MAG: sensor histidine kinase, partial [Hyphomonadaceae bacterium]|nr:sensor histidine kinase [Hyphomonadaceae bacterium]
MQVPPALSGPDQDARASRAPEFLLDLAAENADLRAALVLAESAGIRRELITQELKHRIGNLIAVVQAIARKTFRDADAETVHDFTARLAALAAAQAVLIDAETQPAMLAQVVRDALAPHGLAGDRYKVSGPDITLTGRHAHALTLALHELATNAAKYGALSVEGGVVDVVWSNANGELDFLWRERMGPVVATPTRKGFGSSLITNNLSMVFGGVV